MAYETLNLGLQLTLPTSGTKNWAATLKNTTWTKISQHDHSGSGNGAKLNAATALTANSVGKDQLQKNLALTQAATVTPTGTTATLDLDLGNIQKLDLDAATGDVTVTLSNKKSGASYLILIQQAATPRDIVWPAEVKWPQGQKIILSQTENAVDFVRAYYDGTNFYVLDWDLNLS